MENEMQFFEDPKQEREFDAYASKWLLTIRRPPAEDLAKVLVRAHENLNGGLPSVATFERAWRELYQEGTVQLVLEPIKVEAVAKPEVLTAELYRKIPASQVARKYMTHKEFKKSVDRLIARREI
jgi:hypothetical protein